MPAETKFVPIPQVNSERIKTENLILPEGVVEKVGLHIKRIHGLMQLGGIRTLDIMTENRLGVLRKSPIVEIHDAELRDPVDKNILDLDHPAQWRNAVVFVNPKTVSVIQTESNLENQAKVWAWELNSALTMGLVRAGVKNLLMAERGSSNVLDFALTTFATPWISLNYGINLGVLAFAGMSAVNYASYFSKTKNKGREKSGEGIRFSLLPTLEIDRAALLIVGASVSSLAKALPKTRKTSSSSTTLPSVS